MRTLSGGLGRLMLFHVLALILGCGEGNQPPRDPVVAAAEAKKALERFHQWVEPMSPVPAVYEIESVSDIDRDGNYEVAFRQNVEGNLGWISGFVFRLHGDSLSLIRGLLMIQRSGGETRLHQGSIVASYRQWASTDPHCCPSLLIVDSFSYSPEGVVELLSSDTSNRL